MGIPKADDITYREIGERSEALREVLEPLSPESKVVILIDRLARAELAVEKAIREGRLVAH